MTAAEIVRHIGTVKATAIVRYSDQRVAGEAMAAAIRGGFRSVEFTLNTPGALALIEQTAAAHPDVVVGAGTVLTVEEANNAVKAGAKFLVSPVCDERVIDAANELGVASIPGCHTPTEMWRAVQAGAPMQKLFPAAAGGPAAVRSILGPMPFCRIVPTNGVDATNARPYLDAGAHAVGFVSTLFTPGDMADRAYDRIEDRARDLLAVIA